jgi:hypothetical protein
MDLVKPTHDEELLYQSYKVDHIRIVALPLVKGGLCLDTSEILKGDVDIDACDSVLEFDDRNPSIGDDQGVSSNAHSLEPMRCLEQCFLESLLV